MKLFLVPLIIFSWDILIAQHENSSKITEGISFDSCHLVVYRVVTREMITISGTESKKELKRVKLSTDDANGLLKKISRKASYKDGRAALTHYNLVVEYYRKGWQIMNVRVSSITGNIDINNLVINRQYYGVVSKKMGHYLFNFLSANNLIDQIDPLDLEGLSPGRIAAGNL